MAELIETGWSATFDDTKSYRYELVRQFQPNDRSRCVFLLLNPSTADAFTNDPTVTRCCNFAKAWGHTSIVVLNIFALRSTDPKALLSYPNPVGPENERYFYKWLTAPLTKRVICAWGTWGKVGGRAAEFLPRIQQWYAPRQLECLGVNGDGSPKHPLYLRSNTEPQVYQ